MRRAPLCLGALIAALVAAFTVSPATAGTTAQTSWLCNSATVSSFSSLSQLGAPGLAAARGDQAAGAGTGREPGHGRLDAALQPALRGERAGLGARDHAGRHDRQRVPGADRRPDRCPEQHVRGRGGRRQHRLLVHARGRRPDGQRRLVLREPGWQGARDEAGAVRAREQRAQHVPGDRRRLSSAGRTCRRSSRRGTSSWTASSSTGSRYVVPRPPTAAGTTRARRRRTRWATG